MIEPLQRNWKADKWFKDTTESIYIITLPTAPEITYHAEIIDDALQPQHKNQGNS